MKVDVAFVNFSVSDSIRSLVASKIEDCVHKYSHQSGTVRVCFSAEGHRHQVRLHIHTGDLLTSVSATSNEVGKAVDQAIDRLDAALRKIATRRKARKHQFPASERNLLGKATRRQWNRWSSGPVNAFDRFENEFANEIEEKLVAV